jgi:hypothetical protein
MGILTFNGLTARRLYKSFGVKELNYINTTQPKKVIVAKLANNLCLLYKLAVLSATKPYSEFFGLSQKILTQYLRLVHVRGSSEQ